MRIRLAATIILDGTVAATSGQGPAVVITIGPNLQILKMPMLRLMLMLMLRLMPMPMSMSIVDGTCTLGFGFAHGIV
jgi:hypothetical protein